MRISQKDFPSIVTIQAFVKYLQSTPLLELTISYLGYSRKAPSELWPKASDPMAANRHQMPWDLVTIACPFTTNRAPKYQPWIYHLFTFRSLYDSR